MSSIFALRALLFAGECVVVSTVLFAAAWLLQGLVRRASLRHLVWLSAFALSVAFPLAALIVPAAIVIPVAAPPLLTAPSHIASVASATMLGAPSESTQVPAFDPEGVALLLFALWFAGFAWQMLQLALGAHALRDLRRNSRPHALAPFVLPPVDFRGRECELRLHAGDEGPMTWGFRRAIVLLPRAARGWPAERLTAVLLHELAHVRRHDSLSQSLARVVAAVYWINPLVWLGIAALKREAEIASDDTVLAFGVRPSTYASELVRLASEFRGHRIAVSGVSMASPSALAARVDSVLATDVSRKGATRMDLLKFASLGVAITALLAVAHPALGSEPAPIIAPAPVTPVTPTVPAEPVAPPEPVAPVIEPEHSGTHLHRVIMLDGVTTADRAEIHRAMIRMHADLQRIGPEIQKAMAEAKVDEKIRQAMAEAHVAERVQRAVAEAHIEQNIQRAMADARVHEKVAQAVAEAHVRMRQAIADAHIEEKIAKAMQNAQPSIDAAMAKAMRGHHRVIVNVDDNSEAGDDASVNHDENDSNDVNEEHDDSNNNDSND